MIPRPPDLAPGVIGPGLLRSLRVSIALDLHHP